MVSRIRCTKDLVTAAVIASVATLMFSPGNERAGTSQSHATGEATEGKPPEPFNLLQPSLACWSTQYKMSELQS